MNEEEKTRWRNARRICSPEFFHLYFQLALSSEELTAEELDALIEATAEEGKFAELLSSFAEQDLPSGKRRVGTALDRLIDAAEDRIPKENASKVIGALFTIGDDLMALDTSRERRIVRDNNDDRMRALIHSLLWKLDGSDRVDVLTAAIDHGTAVGTIARNVTGFEAQHGLHGGTRVTNPLFSKEKLDRIRHLALATIRDAADDPARLLSCPALDTVLHRWKDWSDQAEVREWVAETTEDDAHFVAFLEAFSSMITRYGRRVTQYLRLHPRNLNPFLDPAEIIDRVRTLKEDSRFTDAQRRVLEQFETEYDLLDSGTDPDDHRWGEP
jgi:predicted KAP-like P-loop ATPase